MILKEMQTVQKRTYEDKLDDYGFPSREYTDEPVEMMIRIYGQNNVENPLYTGVQLVGITKDFSITDAVDIVVDDKVYHVKFTIPSRRYLQVMLTNE